LNALEKHKSFLFGIFEKENPQWVGMLKEERERKLEKIRNKWLDQVKYTGLLEDEEDATSTTKKSKNDKGKKNYSDAELIEIFNKRLVNDQIDVPGDFYDEEVLFKDPSQLTELFKYLSESARKQISDIDDIRAEIDTQKGKEIENKQRIGGEIRAQLSVKNILEDQI
jgi:hypothetical protein